MFFSFLSLTIISEKFTLIFLGKKFDFQFVNSILQFQSQIKLFSNAGLISFDHPVIKQTSNEQFIQFKFNQIDILFAQNQILFFSELTSSLQYGLIKCFIIYFSIFLNGIIFNIILSFFLILITILSKFSSSFSWGWFKFGQPGGTV